MAEITLVCSRCGHNNEYTIDSNLLSNSRTQDTIAKTEMLNFGQAVEHLKLGEKVAREGWNGKGMYLYKVSHELPYPPLAPDEGWKEGVFEESAFIVMKTADDTLIPWLASQTDILAEDWTIVV